MFEKVKKINLEKNHLKIIEIKNVIIEIKLKKIQNGWAKWKIQQN